MSKRTTNGGRLESYEVRPSRGLGQINWPTGFSGGGWALLDAPDGEVVSRHAFRLDALKALVEHDGLVERVNNEKTGNIRYAARDSQGQRIGPIYRTRDAAVQANVEALAEDVA